MPHKLAMIWVIVLSIAPAIAAKAEATGKDVSLILSAHDKTIRAHRDRDVEALLAVSAPDFILVNRGEVKRPTLDERRARFTRYFKTTRFSVYRDLITPIVHVSESKDSAWLIAQVEAAGSQSVSPKDRDFHFVSA